MTHIPVEPEAFTQFVADAFRTELPRSAVQVTATLELLIDGQRVDLDDLMRGVRGDEEPGAEQVVQHFVDSFINSQRLLETPLPFEIVKAKILPQIRSLDRLRGTKPGFIAAQPFINDTVILYMIDLNDAATPLSTEHLVRWGIDPEEIDRIARENLAAYKPELEMQVYQTGDTSAALFNTGDGYDASRILLSQLYAKLAPEMGGNFLVAIPSRDVFIAFPTHPDSFVDRLRKRVDEDFRSLPYPITSDLFLMTLDGVAPWQPLAA